MATTEEMLARINDRIYELTADVTGITTYRIGDKQVDKAGALRALIAAKESLTKDLENVPTEIIQHIAYDFSEFGEDESEQIGDAL